MPPLRSDLKEEEARRRCAGSLAGPRTILPMLPLLSHQMTVLYGYLSFARWAVVRCQGLTVVFDKTVRSLKLEAGMLHAAQGSSSAANVLELSIRRHDCRWSFLLKDLGPAMVIG